MNFTPQETRTVADVIADHLTNQIVTGAVSPGARLRQEVVARDFGASQAPVREAFRKLEMLRLVESEPRKGVRVCLLNALSERETNVMRVVLEPLAIRSILGKPSALHMASVREALEAGDKALDIYASEMANRAFHITLVAPCRMPRLVMTITELTLAYSRHVFASNRVDQWRARTNMDHWRIFDSYAAGEFEKAARYLADHIGIMDRTTAEK